MKLPRARDLAKYASYAALSVIVSYVFIELNKRFFYHFVGYDEAFFVWGGWSITKGLVPYRDFIEFKPPFVFLTHALALALHGYEGLRYRVFFLYFPLSGCIAVLFALLQRGVTRFLALAVALAIVMLFTIPKLHDTALADSEGIGLGWYLLGFACLLVNPKRPRLRRAAMVAGGVFLSACALSKEPFAPCVVFTWLSCFLMNNAGNLRAGAKQYAIYTLSGVLLVILGLCIYMVPTGGMKAYIEMARGYTRIYRDPSVSYCVVLGKFKPDTPMNELRAQWKEARAEFLNLENLGYLGPLFLVGAAATLKRAPLLFASCAAALVGAVWAVTASNCQWHHYYTMSVSGIVLCLAVSADSISRTIDAARVKGVALRRMVGGAILLGIAITLWPRLQFEKHQTYTLAPTIEPVPGLFKFIAENTTPADKIFTTGPPILYVNVNRVSAVRESNIIDEILGVYPPGTDEEKLRPIYDQLSRNRPKVFVLDPENVGRKRRHYAALLMPFLTEKGYKETGLPGVYIRPH